MDALLDLVFLYIGYHLLRYFIVGFIVTKVIGWIIGGVKR